ncbi:hypothetical protein EOS_20860 [Caballeronia mineralivorans PML1(12)]|uniref:Uncharacterized protein n=1 Tax=Caballeronia mineralivorans PML1(12) TaxID=908627 RepID=A0A0J1CUJ1_9BURK|nr:hypothetical protein EOS_20860 [Caballeronia mineralivorans PML1(12)]
MDYFGQPAEWVELVVYGCWQPRLGHISGHARFGIVDVAYHLAIDGVIDGAQVNIGSWIGVAS